MSRIFTRLSYYGILASLKIILICSAFFNKAVWKLQLPENSQDPNEFSYMVTYLAWKQGAMPNTTYQLLEKVLNEISTGVWKTNISTEYYRPNTYWNNLFILFSYSLDLVNTLIWNENHAGINFSDKKPWLFCSKYMLTGLEWLLASCPRHCPNDTCVRVDLALL